MYHASIDLGQGVDWLRAGQYYLVGTFTGINVQSIRYLSGIAEYDTQHFN